MSSLKTIILKYVLVCVFLVSPCCVHHDNDIAWKLKCFLNCFQIFRLCKSKLLEEKQEGLIDNEEHNKACKEALLPESPSISTHAGTH